MKKIVVTLWLLATFVWAVGDIRILSVVNDPKSDLVTRIEKTLEKHGFVISANSEMNGPFKIQFQETSFEVFHLLTVFHRELSEQLVKENPHAGIFVPMGVGIYQAKGDKNLHVSILTPVAQSKILGLDKVDPKLIDIEAKMLAAFKEVMPKATHAIDKENALPAKGELVSMFEVQTDADTWADAKEELEITIENEFKPKGFVMSNFTDFNFMLTKEETVESPFDFYNTYSICKLKVIYNVAKTRPQAAAFAPCSMMFYKKKDEDKIVMGFPAVYNWMSSAHVTDAKGVEELLKAQKDFEEILRSATE
ncbi:MAG: hypothetical protein KU37_06595 [Sulfuricurvum sp. PC08-66]|nr:MAG: hypothetical protein KU37_06595 [Sulfuricurvum sp. PC08-66]